MKKTGEAKKYARAIVNTVDIKKIPVIIEEVTIFSKVVEMAPDIKRFFVSPLFSEEEKTTAVSNIIKKLGLSEEAGRFLRILLLNGQIAFLKEAIDTIISIYNDIVRRQTASVISPVPIKDSQVKRLRAILGRLINRDVDVDVREDPSLLGGFVVRVGSTIYDSSLKGQLRLLREELIKG